MTVELLWRGFPIARGEARWEGSRAFVPSPTPMPVGTAVTIKDDAGERTSRVAHIVEGDGAGMWLETGGTATAPAPRAAEPAPAPAKEAAPAPAEPPKAAPPAPAATEPTTAPGQPSRRNKKRRNK